MKLNIFNESKTKSRVVLILMLIIVVIPLFNIDNAMQLVMHLGIMTFVYIVLAQSWNILAGLCGLFSLGHAAFFGIGGYSLAIIMTMTSLHPLVGVLIGVILSSLFALLLGAISSKLTGFYFTMSTIALGEVLLTFSSQMISLTKGEIGLSIMRKGMPRYVFYYIAFVMAILATLAFVKLRKTKLGSMLVSIRENENLSKSLGVNTTYYKTAGAIISAILATLAGSFMAYYIQVADLSFLSANISTKVVIITIIGGIGTLWGPVLGAIIILIEEYMRGFLGSDFAPLAAALYSGVLIIMILAKPNGIVSINVKKSLATVASLLTPKKAIDKQ